MGMTPGFFGQRGALVEAHRDDLWALAHTEVSSARHAARRRAGRILVRAGVRLAGAEALSTATHRRAG